MWQQSLKGFITARYNEYLVACEYYWYKCLLYLLQYELTSPLGVILSEGDLEENQQHSFLKIRLQVPGLID